MEPRALLSGLKCQIRVSARVHAQSALHSTEEKSVTREVAAAGFKAMMDGKGDVVPG